MTAETLYLAVYLGSRTSPGMKAWNALDDAGRKAQEAAGIAAWKVWMERHRGAIVEPGGPLGGTRRVSPSGIAEVRNEMSGFVVVRADSLEAAARLFEGHPHFNVFPGEAVEIMPILPIPDA